MNLIEVGRPTRVLTNRREGRRTTCSFAAAGEGCLRTWVGHVKRLLVISGGDRPANLRRRKH